MIRKLLSLFQRVSFGGGTQVVVEIGTDLLKIIQLREGKKTQHKPLIKVVKIADLKQPLEEELPAIFKSLGIQNRKVITYLPRKLVTLRFLEMPSTDDQELVEMVRLQGIKQTPYAPEEVALAYTVVGSRHEGMSDVVLAFCQRKFVDERVSLLERSGLKVQRVGVSTEGVVNWYKNSQLESGMSMSKDVVALIDHDLSFSDIIFFQNGKFLYSKSILLGRNQMALDLANSTENFCQEVKHAIDFAIEETQLSLPKKAALIALIDDGSSLRKALEAKLDLSVEFYNPSRDLEIPEDVLTHQGSITPLFGFGRDKSTFLFDLMPEDIKLAQALEKKNLQMMTTGILILGLLAALGFLVAGNFYREKQYLEKLEQEITTTQEYATSIEEKLARTHLIERAKNPEFSVLSYLKKITDVLPPGVYFSSIDFTAESQIVLKGYAGEMSEVFDFAKALEELKVFKAVKSERVSKKKREDQTLAEFEIDCIL